VEYQDYLELRRRAEKRLTVISIWPLVMFQATAYVLMMIRDPRDLGIPWLAFVGAAGITAVTFGIYRWRTAANRKVRRHAIDDTLEGAVEIGWLVEDPTPRELRMIASLLDDDMETRAGLGRVAIWASAAAALLWLPTYVLAGSLMYREMWGPWQVLYAFLFMFWLAISGGFMFLHQRQRRQSERRVNITLQRASRPMADKPKRPAEAPWWRDEDDEVAEKPKRGTWNDEVSAQPGDDGEISDGYDAERHRRLT